MENSTYMLLLLLLLLLVNLEGNSWKGRRPFTHKHLCAFQASTVSSSRGGIGWSAVIRTFDVDGYVGGRAYFFYCDGNLGARDAFS